MKPLYQKYNEVKISDMIGKTFVNVSTGGNNDRLIFWENDGTKWIFLHEQSCCEHVYIADITGDLTDLIGSPLLIAEESVSEEFPVSGDRGDDLIAAWSFYKFATAKGYVDVRWLGSSNGYYSVSVELEVRSPKSEYYDE